ncbi:CbtA family protein, partial [Kibdelosporangium lantanae]
MRVGNLLVRGMLVGLAGAVLSLVFAYLFGEPQVDSAIGFEGMHSHGGEEEPELVTLYGITETTVHVTFRRIRAVDVTRTDALVGP